MTVGMSRWGSSALSGVVHSRVWSSGDVNHLRPWLSVGKRVDAISKLEVRCWGEVEEFKYHRVLFTSEGRKEQEIDRLIIWHLQWWGLSWSGGEERAEALCLLDYLCSYHHLWSQIGWKNETAKISSWNEFPPWVPGPSLRDTVRSSLKDWVTAPPHQEEPIEMVWALGLDASWMVQTCHNGRRPQGRARTHWRDYISQLTREHLGGLSNSWRS